MTEPNKNILDREVAENNALLRKISSFIKEVVDFATVIAGKCFDAIPKTTDPKEDHLAIISIFMHIIEMLDGIEILIAKSSVSVAHMQVRSIFESLLYLDWILQKDMKERALAYIIDDIRNRIAISETFDPTTQRGKQFNANLKKDKYLTPGSLVYTLKQDSSSYTSKYQGLLSRTPYKEIDAMFGKNSKWYSVHGGGDSIEQLATKLGRTGGYYILYREWSDIVHGSRNLRRRIINGGEIKSLRDPLGIQNLAIFAVQYATEAISIMSDYYNIVDTDYKKWYDAEVKNKRDWLLALKISVEYKSS